MSVRTTPLVLIVDDHYPAAEMMSRLFSGHGYDSICAYNGDDALVQAQKLIPDLILLDVMMPGISGFEVLETLRANKATANIPTILITAKDTPADIERGLNLGADDYLPKPVEPRELLARARSKIEARKLRDDLQSRTKDLEALLRVGEELNNHLMVGDVVNLVLYLLIDLLPCEIAAICRLDEKHHMLGMETSYADGTHMRKKPDIEPVLKAILDGERIISWQDDAYGFSAEYPFGVAVALSHSNQIHGIIVLTSTLPYLDEDIRLLDGIARQTTLALRNAELFQIKVNYAEHLEAMVDARTTELRDAQQLLVRAEKLASVGRLAAGIAHEINNPLQPILINLEHMTEDVQSGAPIFIEDIQETLNSAKRIKRIVEQLLQFTRRRSGATPDMDAVQVYSVIDDVIGLTKKYMQQSNVKIVTKLEQDALVYGSRDQLEQVFLNMVLNARNAMPNGGVLNIYAVVEGNELVVKFSDNGSGIASDAIEKIFEPFFSTHSGSGLGLFISYEIVQNHNGSIDVKSTVGKGTEFTIRFPIIPND